MTTPVLPDRLTLAGGLIGLPEITSLIVRRDGDGQLIELVAATADGLGFAAIAADAVVPGFAENLAERSVTRPGELVLLLLAVHGDPPVVTANLAGPLAVESNGTARQLVLEDQPLRAPIGAPA